MVTISNLDFLLLVVYIFLKHSIWYCVEILTKNLLCQLKLLFYQYYSHSLIQIHHSKPLLSFTSKLKPISKPFHYVHYQQKYPSFAPKPSQKISRKYWLFVFKRNLDLGVCVLGMMVLLLRMKMKGAWGESTIPGSSTQP